MASAGCGPEAADDGEDVILLDELLHFAGVWAGSYWSSIDDVLDLAVVDAAVALT